METYITIGARVTMDKYITMIHINMGISLYHGSPWKPILFTMDKSPQMTYGSLFVMNAQICS